MDTAELWTIGYASVASPSLGLADLAHILERSREANPALGVTGLLLHCDGTFLQVLEGPRAGVNEIYARILASPLHGEIVQLFDHPIAAREFGDWAMASQEVLPAAARHIAQAPLGTNRRLLSEYWHAWSP
jgi:hypothetical protein